MHPSSYFIRQLNLVRLNSGDPLHALVFWSFLKENSGPITPFRDDILTASSNRSIRCWSLWRSVSIVYIVCGLKYCSYTLFYISITRPYVDTAASAVHVILRPCSSVRVHAAHTSNELRDGRDTRDARGYACDDARNVSHGVHGLCACHAGRIETNVVCVRFIRIMHVQSAGLSQTSRHINACRPH